MRRKVCHVFGLVAGKGGPSPTRKKAYQRVKKLINEQTSLSTRKMFANKQKNLSISKKMAIASSDEFISS